MIRLYRKITKELQENEKITNSENKFVFKDVLCPHPKCLGYDALATLLDYRSPIDFNRMCLLN